ncbi:unnamed protein product [Oikopleura dioica]|uniref:Uncharacterized protein n=1 Tax=Oikopleura dioica TaxID=34765 RepID=E4XJE3_OIKDI|nr:unnamed protein product [Oikopleura dioica]
MGCCFSTQIELADQEVVQQEVHIYNEPESLYCESVHSEHSCSSSSSSSSSSSENKSEIVCDLELHSIAHKVELVRNLSSEDETMNLVPATPQQEIADHKGVIVQPSISISSSTSSSNGSPRGQMFDTTDYEVNCSISYDSQSLKSSISLPSKSSSSSSSSSESEVEKHDSCSCTD